MTRASPRSTSLRPGTVALRSGRPPNWCRRIAPPPARSARFLHAHDTPLLFPLPPRLRREFRGSRRCCRCGGGGADRFCARHPAPAREPLSRLPRRGETQGRPFPHLPQRRAAGRQIGKTRARRRPARRQPAARPRHDHRRRRCDAAQGRAPVRDTNRRAAPLDRTRRGLARERPTLGLRETRAPAAARRQRTRRARPQSHRPLRLRASPPRRSRALARGRSRPPAAPRLSRFDRPAAHARRGRRLSRRPRARRLRARRGPPARVAAPSSSAPASRSARWPSVPSCAATPAPRPRPSRPPIRSPRAHRTSLRAPNTSSTSTWSARPRSSTSSIRNPNCKNSTASFVRTPSSRANASPSSAAIRACSARASSFNRAGRAAR